MKLFYAIIVTLGLTFSAQAQDNKPAENKGEKKSFINLRKPNISFLCKLILSCSIIFLKKFIKMEESFKRNE